MNKTSDAQLKAGAKYDRKNTKAIYLKLNVKTDADIIDRLTGKPNIQGYIKELIRNDIKLKA